MLNIALFVFESMIPFWAQNGESGHRCKSRVKALRQGTEGFMGQLSNENTDDESLFNTYSPPLDVPSVVVVVVVGTR